MGPTPATSTLLTSETLGSVDTYSSSEYSDPGSIATGDSSTVRYGSPTPMPNLGDPVVVAPAAVFAEHEIIDLTHLPDTPAVDSIPFQLPAVINPVSGVRLRRRRAWDNLNSHFGYESPEGI